MQKKLFAMILPLIALIALLGCGKLKELGNDAPPGRIVAISPFKCNCDPLLLEAVQDSFINVFFSSTNAKPVKGTEGDIVIAGIITLDEGQTGKSKGAVFGSGNSGFVGGGQSGSSASGSYISGITVQAYKNGELIATHTIGQNLGSGVLISPVSLSTNAAKYISTILVRKNEIGRQ